MVRWVVRASMYVSVASRDAIRPAGSERRLLGVSQHVSCNQTDPRVPWCMILLVSSAARYTSWRKISVTGVCDGCG